MKLQNAFVTEKGDKIGSFKAIGYEMNDTQNFKYTSKASFSEETAALPTTATALWDAEALVALNDCKKASHWSVFAVSSTTGSGLDYTVGIGNGAAATSGSLATDCSVLTASFAQIGTNN